MDRDEAIRRIRAIEPELRALGVTRLALFGSVARGEAGPGSDVDVVVAVEPFEALGLARYFRLKDRLEAELERSVDLVTPPVTHPRLATAIAREAVDAFR